MIMSIDEFLAKFEELAAVAEDFKAKRDAAAKVPTLERDLAVAENTCAAFDGVKWVFDKDNPFALAFPIKAMPNAFYAYEGKTYVYMGQAGIVDELNDSFVEWNE